MATWPLVGREEELALIDEGLDDPHRVGIVVAGSEGVGKTRLMTESLARAATRGATVARVVASRSASAVPFGAFAPLLPDLDPNEQWFAFLKRAAATIAERAAGGRLVIAVDDAHHLDDGSATLLHQLALAGGVRMLLTLRTDHAAPDSVVSLWKDELVRRVELQVLAKAEVAALLRRVLEGGVDGAALQYFWDGSLGNVLSLRELVTAAVEQDAMELDGGVWRLRRRADAPLPLLQLIESRVGALDDDERRALEVVATAETIGSLELEGLLGAAMLDRLERQGLVVTGTDRHRRPVRLAHPLYGELVRRQMTASSMRQAQRMLADVIEARGSRRRGDASRVASFRLAADGAASLETLEVAVSEGLLLYDVEGAELIARAGVAAGGGHRFLRLVAEALRWRGRHDEAEELLGEIDLANIGDERMTALVAMTRAECLFGGLERRAEALAVLDRASELVADQAWLDEMEAMRGLFDSLAGDVGGALARLEPLRTSPHPRVALSVAAGLVPALTSVGRLLEAVELADDSFAAALRHGPEPMLADAALHQVSRCVALSDAGRLVEADATAQLGYESSLTVGSAVGQAWFSLVLGFAAHHQGRLEETVDRMWEASAGFRDLREWTMRRWALATLVQAAAQRGDAGTAREGRAALDEAEPGKPTFVDAHVERAGAWAEVADGDLPAARRRLLECACGAADKKMHGVEAFVLQDLLRLGDVSVADRLGRLRGAVQGPLHEVRVAHAEGLRAGDADALEGAAEAYARLGALLWSAEAWAHAAAAHAGAGRVRRATAGEQRSQELAGMCEGAGTPALRRLEVPRAPAGLTRREQEIATLAGAGTSNREIAARLYLSVRTVENHLQRAYTKLGVSRRAELSAALAADDG